MAILSSANIYIHGKAFGANRHKTLFGLSRGDNAQNLANTTDSEVLGKERDTIDLYFDKMESEAHNGKYFCIINADNMFKVRFINRLRKKNFMYFYSKTNRIGDGQSTEVLVFWGHKSRLFKMKKYRGTSSCMIANIVSECAAHGLNVTNLESKLKSILDNLGADKMETIERMIDIMMYQAIKKAKAVSMIQWKSEVVMTINQVFAAILKWLKVLGIKNYDMKDLKERWTHMETKLLEQKVMHIQVTGIPGIPYSQAA